VAGRAAAVQVDGDVRGSPGPGHQLELGGGQQVVDGLGRGTRSASPPGTASTIGYPEGAPDGPVGGHPGQEITLAQGAEQEAQDVGSFIVNVRGEGQRTMLLVLLRTSLRRFRWSHRLGAVTCCVVR
jgi:hypothetical protein